MPIWRLASFLQVMVLAVSAHAETQIDRRYRVEEIVSRVKSAHLALKHRGNCAKRSPELEPRLEMAAQNWYARNGIDPTFVLEAQVLLLQEQQGQDEATARKTATINQKVADAVFALALQDQRRCEGLVAMFESGGRDIPPEDSAYLIRYVNGTLPPPTPPEPPPAPARRMLLLEAGSEALGRFAIADVQAPRCAERFPDLQDRTKAARDEWHRRNDPHREAIVQGLQAVFEEESGSAVAAKISAQAAETIAKALNVVIANERTRQQCEQVVVAFETGTMDIHRSLVQELSEFAAKRSTRR